MSISDIIKEFNDRRCVPVDVNDVVISLRNRGIKDEIYFLPVDIDHQALRGQFVHWDEVGDYEYPTDGTQAVVKSVAAIFYAKGLSNDWQRLVCCKELLHILDPIQWQANTPKAVEKLTEKIVLPREAQDTINDGIYTLSDRLGMLQAMAVLFPLASREILVKAVETGKATPAEVAKIVDLPRRYTNLVIGPFWPEVHSHLVEIPA